jgi:hypothetical protein
MATTEVSSYVVKDRSGAEEIHRLTLPREAR